MTDSFVAGVIRRTNITVGIATTTAACEKARTIHHTSELATVAIGRLLTAAALAAFSQNRKGQLSLQILGQGRLGSMFTDVTDRGAIRTMVRNPSVALPMEVSGPGSRRSIARGLGVGTLSVIWQPDAEPFTQSTTPLITGEVDGDMEHFLTTSDQVQTALHADVLFSDNHAVRVAGGVVLQAMPDANALAFHALRERLRETFLETLPSLTLESLADALGEPIDTAGDPIPLAWECRCNYERVLNGVRMLGAVDLADMVQKKETAHVQCDFCGQQYEEGFAEPLTKCMEG
ncbi:MAG: Hsp33 family molecular chaperone HslO, partial [Myxococcota bacterium]